MKIEPVRCLELTSLALARARNLSAVQVRAERQQAIPWPATTRPGEHTRDAEAWKDTAAVGVFRAAWCPHCGRHHTCIEQRQRAAAGPQLRAQPVPLDGDEASVKRCRTANGFHVPVVVGWPELRERFSKRGAIPMTCLVECRDLPRRPSPAGWRKPMGLRWPHWRVRRPEETTAFIAEYE